MERSWDAIIPPRLALIVNERISYSGPEFVNLVSIYFIILSLPITYQLICWQRKKILLSKVFIEFFEQILLFFTIIHFVKLQTHRWKFETQEGSYIPFHSNDYQTLKFTHFIKINFILPNRSVQILRIINFINGYIYEIITFKNIKINTLELVGAKWRPKGGWEVCKNVVKKIKN